MNTTIDATTGIVTLNDAKSANIPSLSGIMGSAASMPIVRRGNVVGTRYHMNGECSVKELKEYFKSEEGGGLKGKALTAAVNDSLKSGKDLRVLMGIAFIQAESAKGNVPDVGESMKNGGCLRLTRIKESKASGGSKSADKAVAAEKARADKLEQENKALLARLEKIETDIAAAHALATAK